MHSMSPQQLRQEQLHRLRRSKQKRNIPNKNAELLSGFPEKKNSVFIFDLFPEKGQTEIICYCEQTEP